MLVLYRCVFVESNQGEHFAGFLAGFGVYEEVLHEDFWGSGVRGTVLVVEVFFDVVLFADCFEGLDDLDWLLEQLLAFKENLHKTANTIIDIVHCTTGGEMAGQAGHDERSGGSRQARPRGGKATEWHPRKPQAPKGKGMATLKFCTAAQLKCCGLWQHIPTTALRSPSLHLEDRL